MLENIGFSADEIDDMPASLLVAHLVLKFCDLLDMADDEVAAGLQIASSVSGRSRQLSLSATVAALRSEPTLNRYTQNNEGTAA